MLWLRPTAHLDEDGLRRGLRMLQWDGVCSQMMSACTMGPIMIGFAVTLGASNLVVGLLGAVGPLSQFIQIPAVFLIERTRRRKRITVATALVARAMWILTSTIPLWVTPGWRIWAFLCFLITYSALSAFTTCAFSSWMRDVVPENIMGAFFSKRMLMSTAAGASVSLFCGIFLDQYKAHFSNPIGAYAIVYFAGAVVGYLGLHVLSRVPEPEMRVVTHRGISRILSKPFGDLRFRNVMFFQSAWSFATNFSGPFFAVYMLKSLHLSMTWVLGMTVASQLVNMLFLRAWGRICDRFNNKSVLNLAVPMYFLCLLLWPLMSTPGPWAVLAMVVLFHVFAGIATSGVNLASNNLALLSAPHGEATPYLALNSLLQGMAASVAPIAAGCTADLFERHDLSITLNWHYNDPAQPIDLVLPALHLHGLDFLFLISFVFGLYAIHRLLAVREEGEVGHRVVRRELFAEMERLVRQVSTVAGLRLLGGVSEESFDSANGNGEKNK